MTLTAFNLADGIMFRLGKRMTKQDRGVILKSCKFIKDTLQAKGWEPVDILTLVDSVVYEMKKAEFPLTFRMFYSIIANYIASPSYTQTETQLEAQYVDWIKQEIERIKQLNG